MKYRLTITVKEVRGKCPIYKAGDEIIIEDFYVKSKKSKNICMYALSAMHTLLSAFAHGCSAKNLGIGSKEDICYLQCPDPGPPHTEGGTVLFEIRRETIK